MRREISVQFTAPMLKEIESKNKANLKATADGGKVKYISFKGIVLIGNGHKKEYVDGVEEAPGPNSGQITVDKGSILDSGELTITGCKAGRSEFQAALKRFTKKKLIFK
jgi:hypothetical protein